MSTRTDTTATPDPPASRVALAAVARAAAPGYGSCYRCGMPWKFTDGHITPYGNGHGCFPLCEPCWGELTIEQRLPFYEKLLHVWHAEKAVSGAMAEAVIGAVVRGD